MLAGPGGRGPDHRGPRRPGAAPGGAGLRPTAARAVPGGCGGPLAAAGRGTTGAEEAPARLTGRTGAARGRRRGHRRRGRRSRRPQDPPRAPRGGPVTLQELQRRHELLAVFTCYSRSHLLRVVPQVFLLAVGEVVVAELAGNRTRARAVVRAWRWNLGRLSAIRARRAELQARRRLGDKEIRLLQVRGSARLSAYGRRVFQHGFHGAHADELAAAAAVVGRDLRRPDEGLELEPGRRSHRGGPRRRPGAGGRLAGGRAPGGDRLPRGALSGRLPAVGQFTPFPSWSSTFSQFFAGWHPSGVGTTAPAAPGAGHRRCGRAPSCSGPWA